MTTHTPLQGKCGLPELADTKRALDGKIHKLVKMMQNANHIVVITGAGISTSAGSEYYLLFSLSLHPPPFSILNYLAL